MTTPTPTPRLVPDRPSDARFPREDVADSIEQIADAYYTLNDERLPDDVMAVLVAAIAYLRADAAAPPAEAPAERGEGWLVLDLLIAAGFVTQAKADEAKAIAAGWQHGELAAAPAGEVIGYARIRNGEVTQFSIMRDRDFGYTVPVIAAPAEEVDRCKDHGEHYVAGCAACEADVALGHKTCRFCAWRGIPETAADPYTTDGTVEVCGGCNNAESFV